MTAPGIDVAKLGDKLGAPYDPNLGAQFVGSTGVPVFYKGTRFNEWESKQQGRPVYDAMDFLKVYHPGEPSNVWDQPVREQDKFIYRDAWRAYEAGAQQDVQGTPLSVLFPQHPEMVKHLEASHIKTVEQLAGLTDSALQNVQFGRELQGKAKAYLDIASKGAEFHQVNQKLEQQQAQIADLTRALADRGLSAAPPPDPSGASQALAAANAEIQALKAKLSRTGTRKKLKAEPVNGTVSNVSADS